MSFRSSSVLKNKKATHANGQGVISWGTGQYTPCMITGSNPTNNVLIRVDSVKMTTANKTSNSVSVHCKFTLTGIYTA